MRFPGSEWGERTSGATFKKRSADREHRKEVEFPALRSSQYSNGGVFRHVSVKVLSQLVSI